jgi:hypothetical protein
MPGRRITSEPPPLVGPIPTLGPPSAAAQQGSFMAPPEEYQETRRLVGDAVEDKVTTLSDEHRFAFTTLLVCGKGQATVDVLGHTVTLENLNTDDDLRVGLFCKPYVGSEAYERAFQLATCAAGVRTIGGRAVYEPMEEEPSPESVFAEKAAKLGRYRPVVITEIYRAILGIDVDFVELATKLGKLKG